MSVMTNQVLSKSIQTKIINHLRKIDESKLKQSIFYEILNN